MENPEEILHSLEEFSKMKPKDIPRELEEYLCYVAKTGNPVYQWQTIKSLFREKLLNVITEFYDSCPTIDIPPCPNVELFNYDLMKNFILEKLDTFSAAPFTVQRICELLTTPRKEYNRIDKYMRALEKNILVVSTVEPNLGRRSENGESIMNGLESDHLLESTDPSHDINVEEMDESPSRPKALKVAESELDNENTEIENHYCDKEQETAKQDTIDNEAEVKADTPTPSISSTTEQIEQDPHVTCPVDNSENQYVPIDSVQLGICAPHQDSVQDIQSELSLTIASMQSTIPEKEINENLENLEDIVKQNVESEGSVIKCDEQEQLKPQTDEPSQPTESHEEISTSSISVVESSEPLPSDLQVNSLEKLDPIDTSLTNPEVQENVQIPECSESEKSHPVSTYTMAFIETLETFENEIKSAENMEELSSVVSNVIEENLADSSTCQEETNKNEANCSENIEAISAQTLEINSVEESILETKEESSAVPMEVDTVIESTEKVTSDEPSSTSSDNSF